MYEFKLPDVGEGIHEAEVLQWLVKVGDVVKLDQPILEVQTDKAVVEIPSPVAGTIAEIRAKAGRLAHVGDILVVIRPTEKTLSKAVAPAPTNGQQQTTSTVPTAGSPPGLVGPGRRVLAAPVVRKLARELGVDLAEVPGSGPAGRILPGDVRQFVARSKAAPADLPSPQSAPSGVQAQTGISYEKDFGVESTQRPSPQPSPSERGGIEGGPSPAQEQTDEEPLQGLRRRIAERMELAWRVPHVTSFEEIDATRLVALRRNLKAEAERRNVKLTYMPLIIKAITQTLKAHPHFNASLDMAEQKIRVHRHIHIGVATAVPEGLLVPVIRYADHLSILQLAQELSRLADLAQARKLNPNELIGSTFTLTNFGSFGGRQGTPIINPPEVAILGVGRIEEKPVVSDGQVVIRSMLPLALSYDHRLLDGAAAGAFLTHLSALLSDPQRLFLELV